MIAQDVPPIHVVLAIDAKLAAEAMRERLELNSEIKVVAEARSSSELLVLVKEHQADAILLEIDDSHAIPGVLTHLFDEVPSVVAIGLTRDGRSAVLFRCSVATRVIEDLSMDNVISALRTVHTDLRLAVGQ